MSSRTTRTQRPQHMFKMKAQITLLLSALFMLPAMAQDKLFLVPAAATLKNAQGEITSSQIWIEQASDKAMRYSETPQPDATDFVIIRMKDVDSLFFYELPDFRNAVDLFEARKYKEASEAFAKIKGQHERVMVLKNNIGALAGFYEMECLRKLNDLEGLSKALKAFDKDVLTHELKQRQLELYVLWDALRTEDWERLDQLANERKETKLPGSHRAQVEYCHGRALEGLGRPLDALMSYQMAMTADAAASEVITRESALRVLEILDADPEVKQSIKLYDSSEGKTINKAWAKVMEAAAVANLFELTLGAGANLPDKFKYFLKYKTDPKPFDGPVATEEPKPAAEPENKPAEATKDAKKDPKKGAKKDPKKDAKKNK